jgi:YbbR domain-containing protein
MPYHNLEWKLTALVLALGVWSFVTVNERVGEKSFRVPIELGATPPRLALLTPPGEASITLRGGKGDLEAAADQVQARLSLPEMASGTVRGKVIADFPKELEVVQLRPREITLRFEKVVQKTLPITPRLQGKPNPGYTIGLPQVTPAGGKISGAQSAVNRVARLLVRVDLASAMLGLPQSGLVYPVDASGHQVSGVSLEPQTALVNLPVESNIASKTLPVFPVITGEPASGLKLKSISLDPPLITASGNAGVIRELQSLATVPLSLKDRSASFSRKLDLVIPEGVVSLNASSVEAKVKLTPAADPEGGAASPLPRPERP